VGQSVRASNWRDDTAGLAGVYFLDYTKSSPRKKLGASI
jgi:hypothetical protein